MSRTLLTPQGDGNRSNRPGLGALLPASRTLLTPQGDGNRLASLRLASCGALSRTLLTPQGDGNSHRRRLKTDVLPLGPAPSLPRKGTETPLFSLTVNGQGESPAPSLPRKGTETLA